MREDQSGSENQRPEYVGPWSPTDSPAAQQPQEQGGEADPSPGSAAGLIPGFGPAAPITADSTPTSEYATFGGTAPDSSPVGQPAPLPADLPHPLTRHPLGTLTGVSRST